MPRPSLLPPSLLLFLFLFLLLQIPPLHAVRLRLIEANAPGGLRSWRKGRFLRPPVTTLCPTRRFPSYTLQCITSRTATAATFFVNGRRVRTERVLPFVLTGDSRGVASPWTPPEGDQVMVRCEADDGEEVEVAVRIRCGGRRKVVMPGSGSGGSGGGGDGDSAAGGMPESGGGQGGRSEPRDEADAGVGAEGCVKIGAREFVSIEGAWDTVGGGIVYKRGDDSTGVDEAGEAPVAYEFVAPVTSRYGVTLDMETEGGVDHNDVFLEFADGGFTLNKANGETRRAEGWVKAYHNRNGRALEAFSVDFNPHVFTTTDSLVAGRRYGIRVAGRSTKVTIHAVVLFACEGEVCQGGSSFFQAANKCNS